MVDQVANDVPNRGRANVAELDSYPGARLALDVQCTFRRWQ